MRKELRRSRAMSLVCYTWDYYSPHIHPDCMLGKWMSDKLHRSCWETTYSQRRLFGWCRKPSSIITHRSICVRRREDRAAETRNYPIRGEIKGRAKCDHKRIIQNIAWSASARKANECIPIWASFFASIESMDYFYCDCFLPVGYQQYSALLQLHGTPRLCTTNIILEFVT